nr:MAG TPA: hypothetical protein [Caudoviricetes sp.]
MFYFYCVLYNNYYILIHNNCFVKLIKLLLGK